MIDLHSHIMYGVDDGVRTIEGSLILLRKASLNGITDIVLTPHYIKDTDYDIDNLEKKRRLEILKEELRKTKIDINLYLGNEVYIDDDITSLIENGNIATINNSRYVLMELPLNQEFPFLEEVLNKLKKRNLRPIIAHPERYVNYYNDYDFFDNLIKSGCLFQCNIGSLYGDYGRNSKKMLIGLLKRDMVHFFGSDVHHASSNIYERDIEKDLYKVVKDFNKVDKLLKGNALKVLKNQEVRIGVK